MASPDVLLAEYKSLKSEQQARIGVRDNLLYATFTAVAAVLAAVLTARAPAVMLAAPPVIQVLGWAYLSNDIKVTRIGDYIRGRLAPALGDGAFGWELDSEHPGTRRVRKSFQLAADLAAFPVASGALALAAIIAQSLRGGPWDVLLVTLGAVTEMAMAMVLGWMFTRYAVLGPKS